MKPQLHRHAGLSLVETLVSAVILSGTVVTVGALSSQSLLATQHNRAYEKAASLIDRQLSLIDAIGIDQFLERGITQGDFQDVAPGYRWQATSEYLQVDNLYKLTMTVMWVEGKTPKKMSVTTRLNGTGATLSQGGGNGV